MKFTDLFIKRPVLAMVISLLIFLLGVRSIYNMPLREFPEVKDTVISITTAYPGASAELIKGFITTPIQKAIAGADGLDYITSESRQSVSTVSAHIILNYNPNEAFTSIMSKVAEVRRLLPRESEDPVVLKQTGSSVALMYIGFSSDLMTPEKITDYVSTIVQPKLETIDGVAKAQILGEQKFAMRIWLNPEKMAALNISPLEISLALARNNVQASAGKTKGQLVAYTIDLATDLHTAEQFEKITIKSSKKTLVRLKDVAKIELGSENYDSSVIFNGERAIFLAVNSTPSANPLTVINQVRKVLPQLQKNFPPHLKGKIVYDATKYIRSSIKEVITTIIEATLIVLLVIFLFLGSIRSVFIPILTIPLSLVGVCTLMLSLGYSINTLTLLAMVMAIGMVVDDAIVVVENIHRHIEEGLQPFEAAIQGAREIGTPVITMTLTLAAVYAPIGFMGGITGALFKQFAFTLACAVIISGIVALTLSPMLCAKLLTPREDEEGFAHYLDQKFEALKNNYQRRLNSSLNFRPVTLVMALTLLGSCYFLYTSAPQELAPQEDKSAMFMFAKAPQYANIDYLTAFTQQYGEIFESVKSKSDYFIINGMGAPNSAFAGLILKPWNERTETPQSLIPELQQKVNQIAGIQSFVIPLSPLPINAGGFPIDFVLTSTEDYPILYQFADKIKNIALKSGLFIFINNSLLFNKPEINVEIDRDKAADLGISMQDLASALGTSLGGATINRFSMQGRSYEVIPQLLRAYRSNPEQLSDIYINTAHGTTVPLSTIVHLKYSTHPNQLDQFQQLNAAHLQGVPRPNVTETQAIEFLRQQAEKLLPLTISYDYAGQTRTTIEEGSALIYTFFFAIIIIFLVLAAQFESFRDPFIILFSLFMSSFGALLLLTLGVASVNIYTQVGLVTLIGLISKHGILMVEFANKLQRDEKLSVRAAIEKAASIRLRPILMTTASMVAGVIPLILASGAGSASRFSIGIVIASGMFIGTALSLFVVPMLYTYFAKDHSMGS